MSEEKKPGRKPKITKRVEKEILKAIGEGQTLVYICDQLDITRMTEWNYRQSHPDYRLKLEEALTRRVEIVEDSLYSKAVGGDINAIKFWLTNRAGKNWKNLQDSRISGDPDGAPINIGVHEILVEIPGSVAEEESANADIQDANDAENKEQE